MANRLVSALETKRVLTGIFAFGNSPVLVEILGYAGFDWVTIDMEHSPTTFETAVQMIRAAEAVDLIPLVRVAENNPSNISHALDVGAAGVIIPHINTADELRRAIEACRYAPEGSRGACGVVRSIRYGLEPWETYYRKANQDVIVVPLIEDRQAVENFDEILEVEGVDIYYLGPRDLAQSYGLAGTDLEHPEMRAIASEVVGKANRAEKNMMTAVAKAQPKDAGKSVTAPRPEISISSYCEYLVNLGFRLIDQGADIAVFARTCRQLVNDIVKIRDRLSVRT